jgi:protein O-mannosyl-transferase
MPAVKSPRKRRKAPHRGPKPALVKPRISRLEETNPQKSSVLLTRLAPAVLLAIVTFAFFFPALHHPFANYDDADYLLQNQNVHQGLSLSSLRWALMSTEHANWHPLTWISHMIDWRLYGPNPTGHHLTSLLLHIANVVFLFFFLFRVTQAKWRSLTVSALFAIHPLNVDSVVWIAERKNVLCMFFFLLTLFAYSSYARRPNLWRYSLVALGLALGLAAKPMLVTVPFVLLLLDSWPLQRVQGWTQTSPTFPVPQVSPWRLVLEKLPLLALSAADSVLTMIAQRQGSALRPITKYALPDRLGNAIVSDVEYVGKLIWPTRLAVFYPHPAAHLQFWKVLVCSAILVAMSVWIWRQRSRPYLLVGWLWFLGTLVPVIGLVQVGDQAMANRYVYLPAIGFFIAVVWGVTELAQRTSVSVRRYEVPAAAAVFIILSILTAREIRTWRGSYDLWTQVLAVEKNNAAAEDVIGSEILVSAFNQGQPYSDEALVHFQNAIRIDPKDSEALLNIGADFQAHGKLREALEKYQPALAYTTDPILKFRILTNMGATYEKFGDLETSRQYYRDAMKQNVKDDPTAFIGFARTFTDEQIASLTKSLSDHPTAEGYWKLGQSQEAGGYNDDAKASYQRSLQIDPKFERAHQALDRLEQQQL